MVLKCKVCGKRYRHVDMFRCRRGERHRFVFVATIHKCGCPHNCKYDGARLRLDPVWHTCPTRSCQWEHGVAGCTLHKAQLPGQAESGKLP